MSNQPERRASKRLAATTDYERDDDFQFVRKSKRVKTDEPEPVKKPGRGRPAAKERVVKAPKASANAIPEEAAEVPAKTATTKKSSRRKASIDASSEEPQPKVPKRATRRSTRLSADKAMDNEAEPAPQPAPKTNGASRRKSRRAEPVPAPEAEAEAEPAPKPAPKPTPKPARAPAPVTVPVPVPGPAPTAASAKAPARRAPRNVQKSPQQEAPVESAKIALPMSDTPIINRNKEMRKKGNTNRRSSLGMRGRRASSLIESGQTAIPHREVNPADFYKHIEAEGLTEPRRMKQLLTWCGERALAEKPPHGTPNSNAILGARAIQDQLLKDFASRSEFSDWFSRDDDVAPKAPVVLQPNPRNTELDEKMAELEVKIKKLQVEKKAWLAIKKPPAEQPPLFSEDETEAIVLPDFNLLDEDEGRIRGYLADETASFDVTRSRTESRLRKIQSTLEFQVDQLADNIHKLEQRVLVAGKEADKVLSVSAMRLRQREEREKKSTGTKDMPVMEVLRSLGSMLPEGGG